MTGCHIAFPPNSEICRGYVVAVAVNRYGHPKIPLFSAMTMGDTEKPKVNSCFSWKTTNQEPQTYCGRPAAALALFLSLSTVDVRFLEITGERERPVPNMNRLVVALTKPKQQLTASHSGSIAPSPVTVSLLLPKRISAATNVYPTLSLPLYCCFFFYKGRLFLTPRILKHTFFYTRCRCESCGVSSGFSMVFQKARRF